MIHLLSKKVAAHLACRQTKEFFEEIKFPPTFKAAIFLQPKNVVLRHETIRIELGQKKALTIIPPLDAKT